MKLLADTASRWKALSERYPNGVNVLLLSIAVLGAYVNSLDVPFVMDDFVIYNFGPQNLLDILVHGGQRRFVDFSLAINYHLHETLYTGYHLVNISIHLLATFTLYFFIASCISALMLTRSSNIEDCGSNHFVERFIPFSTALFFAVHPIQTQAVTYIIQRYASLATLLYLLSTTFYIRARISFETHRSPSNILLLGSACVFTGLLALGSKQIAFTLPIMVLVLEIFLFRGKLFTRRFFIIFGILGGVAFGLALLYWHDSSLNDVLFDLRHISAENRYISRSSYFFTQCRVILTYLRLLFFPINQSIFYDYPVYSSLFSFPVGISVSIHVLNISVMIMLDQMSGQKFLKNDYTNGTILRLAALGIAWFYLSLTVESSIFPIRDVIFEHRLYLPSAGFFIAVSAGIAFVVNRRTMSTKTAWIMLFIITLSLGAMTIARNQLWRDPLKLWQDTVSKAPMQHLALSNLAIQYLERKDPITAIPLFVKAIELCPAMDFRIKVYFGEALQESNQIDKSRFTTGKEYMLPDYSSSSYKSSSVIYNNLGLAYEYMALPEKALTAYTKALGINPDYYLAWYNLGIISAKMGDRNRAKEAAHHLEKLQPQLAKMLTDKIK